MPGWNQPTVGKLQEQLTLGFDGSLAQFSNYGADYVEIAALSIPAHDESGSPSSGSSAIVARHARVQAAADDATERA
jgi:hypothetical protein